MRNGFGTTGAAKLGDHPLRLCLTTGINTCSGELFVNARASVHSKVTTETNTIQTPKQTPIVNHALVILG